MGNLNAELEKKVIEQFLRKREASICHRLCLIAMARKLLRILVQLVAGLLHLIPKMTNMTHQPSQM